MSSLRKSRPTVAVVAYDGLCTFEFGIAVEAFGLPRPEYGNDWYLFGVYGVGQPPYRAVGGISVEASTDVQLVETADLIVIPGWRDIDELPPANLIGALRDAHERGARIMSICSGVFVLAATGLLDGVRATTHWRYTSALKYRYPKVDVDADVLYVDGGQLLTSAGSAAGIDLALHIIRQDFGAQRANEVARRMVVPAHRDGGQAQFIERPVARRPDMLFSQTLAHLRKDIATTHRLSDMADKAGMSKRTFVRHFKRATGTTPNEWLIQERVGLAKEMLETTRGSIDEIAFRVGFGSAFTFRHHFRRLTGTSPSRYRAGSFFDSGERNPTTLSTLATS